ncbi:hypothetical protein PMIN04_010247 [Paraphaeosphaeria minitans]|uniref:Uncharacterized protein n=1 Tax=Paraphaeosphaeria minitans TaxID=565426 RepID=A0A9P6KML6_9PLEO|nr:hypothetical protein PMIN01_09526 [Paraphaeosphaeria minitans]
MPATCKTTSNWQPRSLPIDAVMRASDAAIGDGVAGDDDKEACKASWEVERDMVVWLQRRAGGVLSGAPPRATDDLDEAVRGAR